MTFGGCACSKKEEEIANADFVDDSDRRVCIQMNDALDGYGRRLDRKHSEVCRWWGCK